MSEPHFFSVARNLMRFRSQAPPLLPVSREQELPLSFPQERLWFLEQFGHSPGAYNLPYAARLRGMLDRDALVKSFEDVVRRHEVLRTTFASSNGKPIQIVNALSTFALAVEDVANESDALQRMAAEAQRTFDLARGPLFVARLLRLSADDHVLLLNVHHIVYDGWSQDVLFRELSALYDARRNRSALRLSDLPVQYVDYAVWQRQFLAGPARQELLTYWKAKLAGRLSAPQLPMNNSGTRRLAIESIQIAPGTVAAMDTLAREVGTTPFVVLLSAFQTALHSLSGQEDFVVCTPVASRNRKELDGLIGYIANLVILRADVSGDPPLRTMVDRNSVVVSEALEHQDLPIQLLNDLEIDGGRVSRVMFAFHNIPNRQLNLSGLTATPISIPAGMPDFDFYLSLERRDGAIAATAKYDGAQFDPTTAREVLRRFSEVLQSGSVSRTLPQRPQPAAEFERTATLEPPQIPSSLTRETLTTFLQAHVTRLRRGEPARADDSLHSLGFDSLKMIELANQIRTALAIDVPVSDFLKPVTIAELAGELLQRAAAARVLQSRPSSPEAEGDMDILYL
ncbi:MAG: condensation domain-containing protein [Acidobacteriota bacterium]|nr:condensation domain-containing protein [Acidobacteriota bacterium]